MTFYSNRYKYRGVSGFVENKIKKTREEQGISRSKLAEEINISYQILCRLENHGHIPTLLTAFDLASALNKTIEELFIFK